MPLYLALICIAVASGFGFLSGVGFILVWQGFAAADALADLDESHAAARASAGY